MAKCVSHHTRRTVLSLFVLFAISLALGMTTARCEDLPLGEVELRRKTGNKKAAFLKGTVRAIDSDTIVLQQPGKVLRINQRDVSGIRYMERYTEPLVGEDLPIKFVHDESTKKLVRHKVAIEIGRWTIQQSVDVDQVTVTQFGQDSSGGLTAVSVTGNVQRNA